jgi:hypothetical protein
MLKPDIGHIRYKLLPKISSSSVVKWLLSDRSRLKNFARIYCVTYIHFDVILVFGTGYIVIGLSRKISSPTTKAAPLFFINLGISTLTV